MVKHYVFQQLLEYAGTNIIVIEVFREDKNISQHKNNENSKFKGKHEFICQPIKQDLNKT